MSYEHWCRVTAFRDRANPRGYFVGPAIGRAFNDEYAQFFELADCNLPELPPGEGLWVYRGWAWWLGDRDEGDWQHSGEWARPTPQEAVALCMGLPHPEYLPLEDQALAEPEPTTSDAVVVVVPGERGKVVAVHRRENRAQRCMPGGRVNPGERPRHAAERELLEEAGFSVVPGDLVYAGSLWVEVPAGSRERVIVYIAPAASSLPTTRAAERDLDAHFTELDDLCDDQKHGRFAYPARVARTAMIGRRWG